MSAELKIPKEGEFDKLSKHLDEVVEQVNSLKSRIQNFVEELVGSEPPSKDCDITPSSRGYIGRINDIYRGISQSVQEINQQLNRL